VEVDEPALSVLDSGLEEKQVVSLQELRWERMQRRSLSPESREARLNLQL
jgi:hypothetical protein